MLSIYVENRERVLGRRQVEQRLRDLERQLDEERRRLDRLELETDE